jgi:glycosyltransferase involved in cell wall biosynthesis
MPDDCWKFSDYVEKATQAENQSYIVDQSGILYDLTEFIANPIRTGIQRVTLEILARWTGSMPLIPVALDDRERLFVLSPKVNKAILGFFRANDGNDSGARDELLAAFQLFSESLSLEQIVRRRAVLNAELFFSQRRIEFYHRLSFLMGERLFFLAYDFLPALHPEFFPQGAAVTTMPYVRLVRNAKHVSFISDETRHDYMTRIKRRFREAGPAFALGSDGLGRNEPIFSRNKRNFIVIGTLEPRKNTGAILDAFEALWDKGENVSLTFAGRLVGLPSREMERIESLRKGESRFAWFDDLTDDQLRERIAGSRATIFASVLEGFGIPPLESLALGVPVIVSRNIPSIRMIESAGQIRLEDTSPENIRQAVLLMLDDDYAQSKYDEIRGLKLPTWAELAGNVASWIEREI